MVPLISRHRSVYECLWMALSTTTTIPHTTPFFSLSYILGHLRLLAQGIGEAQQSEIIQGVSASLVEKLGEGAAPLLLGSDFNPAGGEGSWEDDKYSIVSMLALSRFSVSSGLAG